MTYTLEIIEDLPFPTLLNTIHNSDDIATEMPRNMKDIDEALARIEGSPVYVIFNQTDMNISLGTLTQGLATIFRPRTPAEASRMLDDRVRLIVVGQGTLMKLAAQGLRHEVYGGRQIEMFETVEEAFDLVRQATTP
jgi:hypothetical protein